MTTLIRFALTLSAAATMALSTGCASTRTISGHNGCDARVTNPEKRAACHACVSRGPHFSYQPGRAAGKRCVRL